MSGPVSPTDVRLIVNGDDFGVSRGVNEAIIRAFRGGVLSSASLMVTGDGFDQAVRLARENAGLAVGIHLVTVMGKSVLEHSEIPHLVDSEGRFSSNPTLAGLRYHFSPHARRELEKELSAQFEKFAATGLTLSHIDSHLHMHVHPVIFSIALKLGERHGVRRMRLPRDELLKALRFDSTNPLGKSIYALVFALLAERMRKRLQKKGFTYAERVYGNISSGRMSEEYVRFILEQLPPGTAEIYLHPALHAGGKASDPAQRQCRREFDILMSPGLASRIKELGITLTNYTDMEARWVKQ